MNQSNIQIFFRFPLSTEYRVTTITRPSWCKNSVKVICMHYNGGARFPFSCRVTKPKQYTMTKQTANGNNYCQNLIHILFLHRIDDFILLWIKWCIFTLSPFSYFLHKITQLRKLSNRESEKSPYSDCSWSAVRGAAAVRVCIRCFLQTLILSWAWSSLHFYACAVWLVKTNMMMNNACRLWIIF